MAALVGRPSLGGRALAKAIAPPKKVFSFPILEAGEIVDVLREMGAAITEDDIAKPKPDTFRQWCEMFVQQILGIELDELYRPATELVGMLDGNEDLHEASVPVAHFIAHMNKVLEAAHCEEGLTLRDLMRLERARAMRLLSALINLSKFREEKLPWIRAMEAEKADLERQRAEVEAQHQDVLRRIAAEKVLRDGEQPAIAGVRAECARLEGARNGLYTALEAKRGEAQDLKAAIATLKDKVAEVQARAAAIRSEADASRAHIVSSPAKVKAEAADLEAAVEAEARGVSEAEAHQALLGRQMAVVAKAEKDVRKAMLLMAEAEAEAVKLKRIMKEEKAKRAELDAAREEEDALKESLEHAAMAQRRAEEKLAEAREAVAQRLAAQARALDALRREAADYSEEARTATDARRAAEAEAARLERRREGLVARHAAEVADALDALKRLSAALTSYHSNLAAGMRGIEAGDAAAAAGKAASGVAAALSAALGAPAAAVPGAPGATGPG